MATDETRVDALVADIDRQVAAQLDAIVEHPSFRALARTWRALGYVVDMAVSADNVVIEIFDARQSEFSAIDGIVARYELVVALYEFSPRQADLETLRALGARGAPVVTALAPRFFGAEPIDAVDLGEVVEGPEYAPYRALRESEASRDLVLTLTDVRFGGHAISAAATVAALALDSFARYRWAANIIDTPIPGPVEKDYKIPARTQAKLLELGLVAPVSTKGLGIVFRALPTARAPEYFGEGESALFYELARFASSQLPYRLLAGRFVTYLRAMAHERGLAAPELGTVLTHWLGTHIQCADITRKEPFGVATLRAASFHIDGSELVLSLRPAMRLYAPHLPDAPYFTFELRRPL